MGQNRRGALKCNTERRFQGAAATAAGAAAAKPLSFRHSKEVLRGQHLAVRIEAETASRLRIRGVDHVPVMAGCQGPFEVAGVEDDLALVPHLLQAKEEFFFAIRICPAIAWAAAVLPPQPAYGQTTIEGHREMAASHPVVLGMIQIRKGLLIHALAELLRWRGEGPKAAMVSAPPIGEWRASPEPVDFLKANLL